ncbi:TonB-dependent receptor [Flavobacterium agricola]|uniref:TonB-dependent receptor n=1 Tax=Flavobacterium agricola TaxID=2870839 RepID=A0ABY6LZB2_9FLAO|nr:TonB-dependent receptor [Flavobacterium agricola]UYW01574.1 TonB-dependent receptor [Flavobacterium agricola]
MYLKKIAVIAISVFGFNQIVAQVTDSIQPLNQVIITSFKRNIPYLESTSSAARISSDILQLNHPERLLDAVNMVPGVMLEERSPGSYRVSMRGSTIRSPFGVRNVKIYLDDFILTDVSGNSYLNLIDPNLIAEIAVLKGPQGGEIGSESGGALLLQTTKKEALNLELLGGSYNMFAQRFNLSKQLGKHFVQIAQSYYDTDSYREQAAVNKKSFFIKDDWKYNHKNTLNLTLLYTDLFYETPGGLTWQQMQTNRRQARLATPTLPSAETQKASIYNKTVLGGLAHLWKINENWSQFTLVQSSFTDFKNPFISNYEVRNEKNLQGRLFLQYQKQLQNVMLESRLGLEAGTNASTIKNYDNLAGNKGNAQKFDAINTHAAYYFFTQRVVFANQLFVDAGISLNTMQYDWKTTFPEQETGKIHFKNQVLPSLGATYKLNPTWFIRAKIAKGTSAPTSEEVRSSNQQIATNLMAEYGWNKEIGLRKKLGALFLETTYFDYLLKDAIVKRQDAEGNDYFINSGGTKQRGIEFLIESDYFTWNQSAQNQFKFYFAGHYYDFSYDDYQINQADYSGKVLPGISKWSVQSLLSFRFNSHFTINYANYYHSSLFLNDANTEKAKGYVVGNLQANRSFKIDKHKLQVYLSLNNIYNTKYSAGYDLNAFGNRFYNPAAIFNFHIGTKFSIN